MSFNRTYWGASGSYLAAPLCVPPPPAPDPGQEEVGSDAALYVEQPLGGRNPISM